MTGERADQSLYEGVNMGAEGTRRVPVAGAEKLEVTTGPGSLAPVNILGRGFDRFNTAAHSKEAIDAMVDADLAADQMGSR